MLYVKAEQFSKLLGAQETTGIEGLVQNIKEIEEKLANPEEQSFYFRMGIESNRKFLKKYKDRYNAVRLDVNEHNIDFINKKVVQTKQKNEKIGS